MTSIQTVRKGVNEIRRRANPKRTCLGWLEQDGYVHTYERNGRNGQVLRKETPKQFEKRMKAKGYTEIILVKWCMHASV